MHKKLRKEKIVTFSIILLMLTFFTALPIPRVSAVVSINQLSPAEGPVGTVASVTGQISTENGSYIIFFGDEQIKSGSATLYDVSDTFIVPNSTYGSYPVKLQDTATEEYSTLNFTVQTHYIIKAVAPPHPEQMQEGANATILAIVTGGSTMTSVNITITDPANVTHSSLNINIPTAQDGYGETNRKYPTDFDESPHTFYAGTYNMSLSTSNETLATGSFTIGLTNATEYHRFQTVYVQALNYTSTDMLKVKITHNDEIVFESTPRNASEPKGIITANWTIPANASLGLYKVEVRSLGTEKPVPENQTFTIVSKSFACEVKTVNLDNEPSEGIVVEANNSVTFTVSTNTTNKNGLAFFYLEATNYTFAAFLNNTQVGATADVSLAGNLTGTVAPTITCSLAHIKIAVRDSEGCMLPFVSVSANFTYTTRANKTEIGTASTETNLTGIAIFRNLFTNNNYTIKASRYGQTFNTTTINLTSTSWFDTTCPTLELIVKVFDRNGAPLQDAVVNVYDWGIGLNGLVETGNTSTSGEIVFNSTFGKYIIKIYKEGTLLNETTVLLTDQPTTFAVYCKLYKLTLDVSVLDYFGQGILNANVTIEREGIVLSSSNTGGNGVAQFTELIGGDYKIFVYTAEKPYKITVLHLQEPKTVTLKIEGIMSIGGFITETSHLITVIFILLVIVVFLLAFIYRRLKSRQTEE